MTWTNHSTPEKFFGKGYDLASSELTLTANAHAGVTVGAMTADATDLITVVGHCLRVGDKVQFATDTTLPSGLAVATDYFVISTPDADTFTVAAGSVFGTVIDTTDAGTGTHSLVVMGLLPEITDAEADPTTGDARKVIYGMLEMLYAKFSGLPLADRPTKIDFTRTTTEDQATGEFVKRYNITIRTGAAQLEVANE
jgi:hypothetical protein